MKNIALAIAIVSTACAFADDLDVILTDFSTNCPTASQMEILNARPISGDRVVINDMTYVLLSETAYRELFTNLKILSGIATRNWRKQHETEAGRREWHGDKTETIVDTTNGTKTVVYSDGYQHVEKFVEKKQTRPTGPVVKKTPPNPDFSKLPPRLRKAREGVNIIKEVK